MPNYLQSQVILSDSTSSFQYFNPYNSIRFTFEISRWLFIWRQNCTLSNFSIQPFIKCNPRQILSNLFAILHDEFFATKRDHQNKNCIVHEVRCDMGVKYKPSLIGLGVALYLQANHEARRRTISFSVKYLKLCVMLNHIQMSYWQDPEREKNQTDTLFFYIDINTAITENALQLLGVEGLTCKQEKQITKSIFIFRKERKLKIALC